MARMKIVISSEYKENEHLMNFVNNILSRFDKEGIILYDKRNVIKEFAIDSSDNILKTAVVKRYKFPNIIQRIVYSFFRATKARRAFNNASELRRRGIDTPREIAYIEQWNRGLFSYGYYISGSDDAPPIRDRMIEPEEFDRTMAANFAAFAARLHEKGILHHDLNSTNVLYHTEGDHYGFSVIDINRMKFFPMGKQPSRKDCFENLTRFTGRMDLFKYVLHHYAKERNWDVESTVKEAVAVKNKHDEAWRRRKEFLRKFKPKKKRDC